MAYFRQEIWKNAVETEDCSCLVRQPKWGAPIWAVPKNLSAYVLTYLVIIHLCVVFIYRIQSLLCRYYAPAQPPFITMDQPFAGPPESNPQPARQQHRHYFADFLSAQSATHSHRPPSGFSCHIHEVLDLQLHLFPWEA